MPFFGSLAGFSVRVVSGPPVVGPLSNTGSNDAFVVKYDAGGTPLWARRLGGTSSDVAYSVTRDSSGNVIVVGTYQSSLNIYAANGSTVSFSLTNSGGQDAFVVKYDSSGTPLWVRRMGGTGFDQARSVIVDSSGNVIVTGYYASNPLNIYAANGTTVLLTLPNSGSNDSFVVKYDSSGTPLWVRRIGGAGSDTAFSVSTDSSENIVVAGQYASNPLSIFAADGNSVFAFSNPGTNNAFVVKYDPSGTPLWARKIGGYNGSDGCNSVTTDSSGNVIVTGNYTSIPLSIFAANGATESFSLTNSGSNDAFIVKYDSSGTPLWVRRLGGTSSDIGNSVMTDSTGNIIVTGNYASSPVNIFATNGSTVSFTLSNSAGFDAFIVKYNSGGTPLWARKIGGYNGNDRANSVSVDSSGNIVVAGQYSSNPSDIYAADGTTVSFTLANSGGEDVFVVKYDSSGTPLWARRVGGTLTDVATSVNVDSSGNIVVAGYYISTSLSFN